MEKKFYYAAPKPVRCGKGMDKRWEHVVPVYRMAPHVWNVGGQDDVSVYLLDTGEGLILLDTGYDQTLYLVIDNIWRLGFDPKDIKKILISHWHGDHVNGCRLLQEMCQAEVWISEIDEENHQLHKDDTVPMKTVPYHVDQFYDFNKPIELGRFTIRTRLTPGHTTGAVSFFFDDTDDDTGRTYHCAMHGGIGVELMRPEALKKVGVDEESAHQFVRDCLELAEEPVDIFLASHLNQGNIDNNIPEDKNDYTAFVAEYVWGDVMRDRAEAVKKFYPETYPEV